MGLGAYDSEILRTEIQIADFGFSVDLESLDNEKCQDNSLICGTAGYFAPEIMNSGEFHLKSDIFSTGCILYNMISGN